MGFTSRTLLSSVDRALGVRDFPFAGGSSVKSIYFSEENFVSCFGWD